MIEEKKLYRWRVWRKEGKLYHDEDVYLNTNCFPEDFVPTSPVWTMAYDDGKGQQTFAVFSYEQDTIHAYVQGMARCISLLCNWDKEFDIKKD